jgi:catechol 2,3-dioxygenase-like lactoylglutathione lyase family enzyme
MFSHITVGTTDLARSKAFYDAVLGPLGITACMEFEMAVAYGEKIGPKLFVVYPFDDNPADKGNGWHAAFAASDRAAVDGFHKAAVAKGGTDEGAPGLRPHYHPDYYAAYVRDPDGNKIQAVCHMPEQA